MNIKQNYLKSGVIKHRVKMSFARAKANTVSLVGDFNQWDPNKHPMKQSEEGIWEKIVVLHPGNYEYKFLVDGKWENDPQNPDSSYNQFGTLNNILNVS
jgi:5'-AMP-activated protein kinase regulatory beta subunit